MEKKFLLINIFERNGEYEYNTKVLNIVEDQDVDEFVDNYTKDWYGTADTAEESNGGYYLNGGEIYVMGSYKEINEATYNLLKELLN